MRLASPDFPRVAPETPRRRSFHLLTSAVLFSACAAIVAAPSAARGQTAVGLLTTRDELSAAATQAERTGNSMEAAAIRARLRDGDFQVGDRIVFTMFSDALHTDTLVVRNGLVIDLPGKAVLPLSGVLRSELRERVTAEVLKYVKAVDVNVTPLTRIGVLGEVARPGFFALRSDLPITDAIMLAGGPTASADLERSFVRRASREYRSAQETRQAVRKGLTLDQFGFNPGDELIVGRQRQMISPRVTALVGLTASITGIWFLLNATGR